MKYYSIAFFFFFKLAICSAQNYANPEGPITTSWDQEGIYNSEAPTCGFKKAYIGCTTVALGQVLNYYGYPNYNVSFPAIELKRCFWYNNLSVDYNNFNGNLFSGNEGEFLYDLATSILTLFTNDAGGYNPDFNIYITYESELLYRRLNNDFNYTGIQYLKRSDVSLVEFKNQIINNIENCQPVMISGFKLDQDIGHFWIIDDYDYSTGQFHMNFGWGPDYNDFYYLEDSRGFTLNQQIIVGIKPNNGLTACQHLSNMGSKPYNATHNTAPIKSIVQCPTLIYPTAGSTLTNNIIDVVWTDESSFGYYITITDLTSNVILVDQIESYGGKPAYVKKDYYPANSQIEVLIEPFDINNNITSCSSYTFFSSGLQCNTLINYAQPICIEDGSEYIIEVNFVGEPETHDLFATWDGIVYDSEDSVLPGYYILGPFDTSQVLAIVVENENNPFDCFSTSLIHPDISNANCIPDPTNSGGNNNGNTCNIPTGSSHSINGTTATFYWDAMPNSTSYTICESTDGITDSGCNVITTNSYSISGYAPCNTFYWRVRNNCNADASVYTAYQPFTVSNGSGGTCNMPSNVEISENSTSIIVTWNAPNSGSSPSDYLLRYSVLGTNNWSVYQTNGGQSLYISNLQPCTDYEVQVKSICGCSESGWTTSVSETTNGCSAPTCSDGIMNGTETGVDCGGNCNACSPGVCDDFLITNPNPSNCNTQFALVSSVKNIIWSPGNCGSGLVNIEYSINGGSSWVTQVNNTADDGVYSMTFTSAHASNQFRLRVSCTTGGACAETCNYVVFGDTIHGCTNQNAHNYNPAANYDNGTCETCYDGLTNGDETGIDCGGSNPQCNPCNPANNVQMTGPCNGAIHGWDDQIDITWNPGSNSCNRVWFETSDDNGLTWVRRFNVATGIVNDGLATLVPSSYDLLGDILIRIECTNNPSNNSMLPCALSVTSCGGNIPVNNEPCGAVTLPVSSVNCNYQTFSTCDFMSSNVPNPGCEAYTFGDIWYKVVVPASGNLNIQTDAISTVLPAFALYGGACSSLSMIECNGYNTPTYAEQEYQNLSPGTTVYIRWWSSNFGYSSIGDFDICVYEPEVCTGDIIAWPVDVSIECESDANNLSIVGDVLGETTLCPTCSEATYVDNNNYVTCTGGLITRQWTFIDECNITYTHNQIIYITGDQTPPTFNEPADIVINCDQDFTNLSLTGNVSNISDYCSGSTLVTHTDDTSNLDYCTNTGYVIRFWIAEDDCSNAITKIQFIHLINNNCEATRCEGESCYTAEEITSFNTPMFCDGPSFGGSASASDATHADWFYFDAPYDGEMDVFSCFGGVDTRLFIWEGNCSNLIALANNDDNCLMTTSGTLAWASELIGVPVQAGQRYYIEWDSKWNGNPFNWYFRFYGCNDVVTTFPAIMEFENGIENYIQDSEDVLDWSFISGPTPSAGTGTSATYSMSDYIFVESSGNNVGFPNKTATIYSPCYDLTSLTNPELSFAYNMEGVTMGSLGVLVSDNLGRTWTVKFNKSGDQGPGWHKETIDLSAFANSEIKIMFEAFTGTGYQSDICIDQIIVKEKCASTCSNTISNYNYTNQFISGIGDFEQQSSCDDLNWTHNTGATPSVNTGPSAGFINPGYMYIESSGNNVPYKMAVIESPCFNVSSLNLPTITFRYHMYGLDMGFFEVEISDDNGATWDQLLVRNGDYGDNWFSYFNNDLSGYGNTIKFRITGITGDSYRSDMALDYFWIYETCPDNYTFTGNQNLSSLYEAKFNITSSRTVNVPILKYDAGQTIDLLPGFEVSLGTQFDAYIDGCGDNGNEQFAPSDSVSNSLRSEPVINNEKK